MAHGDSLAVTVEATQRSLEDRLGAALARHAPRDGYAAMDTFMAATSRHMAAVEAVLVPAANAGVPEGHRLARQYLDAARRLELTLALVKARLYGEAQSIHMRWAELWHRVREELDVHNDLERRLVEELISHGDPAQVEEMARRIFDAETRAPTRPHPRLPHTGRLGGVTRRVWAVADRFWDAAEGRVIPEPVRPAPHRHDSLMAQYVVGDPQFVVGARLTAHRRRPSSHPG